MLCRNRKIVRKRRGRPGEQWFRGRWAIEKVGGEEQLVVGRGVAGGVGVHNRIGIRIVTIVATIVHNHIVLGVLG